MQPSPFSGEQEIPELLRWAKRQAADRERRVLLHYHIFKNAGTTVSFILKRNFGNQVAFLDSGDLNGIVDNRALIDFLEQHPKIKAVSSHQLRPPKPQSTKFRFLDILFLRDPLARFSSTYDFYRRSAITADPLTCEAKNLDIENFMRLLIEKYPYYVDNVQVKFLAAMSRLPGETELQAAIRIAGKASVLGVTEEFDIAAVTAECALQDEFDGLNFGYFPQNVSSMKPRELEVHLAQFREACGERICEQLLQQNVLDQELWTFARREALRRFASVPDHENRLKNFRVWRNALDPGSIRGVLASNHPDDFIHYANFGIN